MTAVSSAMRVSARSGVEQPAPLCLEHPVAFADHRRQTRVADDHRLPAMILDHPDHPGVLQRIGRGRNAGALGRDRESQEFQGQPERVGTRSVTRRYCAAKRLPRMRGSAA
jgi:hypothetical protein